MERTSLKEWCKDAGPIGPALWMFDGLVELLANGLPHDVEQSDEAERDENAASFGLVLIAVLAVGMFVLLGLILISMN